jgi:hypothetical protein
VWDRGLLRRHIAALPAGAQLDTRIERLNGGFEFGLDVGDVHSDGMQLSIAALAEPEQRFGLVG